MLHPTDLYFDIEKGRAAIALQNIFQTGRRFFLRRTACLKLLERVLADYKMVELGVMTDDRSLVAGRADVKFKTVDAVAEHVTPVLRVAPTLASFEAAYAGRR